MTKAKDIGQSVSWWGALLRPVFDDEDLFWSGFRFAGVLSSRLAVGLRDFVGIKVSCQGVGMISNTVLLHSLCIYAP